MALNEPFQHQSSAVASFSFTELSQKVGYVKYYGVQTTNNSATEYVLTPNPVYSDPIETTSLQDGVDLDFDLTAYNGPTTIRGVATVNYCIGSSNAAGSYSMTMTLTIKKVSGGVETTLATATAPNHGKNEKTIFCMQLDIPKTHFKKDDILRLTFTPAVTASGESGVMGTDPQDRDGVSIITPSSDDPVTTTKLEVYIPYELSSLE